MIYVRAHFFLRTALNRDTVLRVTEELRLLFATRVGQKLTASQVRHIVQTTNSNLNNNQPARNGDR